MSSLVTFGWGLSTLISTLLVLLNTTIYKFVGFLYEVFLYLAGARLVTSSQIEPLIHRIEIIVGVVMLFIVAVSIIKSIVDPDKEVKNTSKIFVNLITSLIMFALVNPVFNYLYEGQNYLLKSNVIGKVILGSTNETACKLEDAGFCMAVDTLSAFFEEDFSAAIEADECLDEYGNEYSEDDYLGNDDFVCYYELSSGAYATKSDVEQYIKNTGNMTKGFSLLISPYENGAIDYSWFLAIIAGLFMVYIFVSFCIDMAVRVAKLAILQIISPIAIISRIIPGQESIFNNWLKKTMTAFMEVFIKIAIVFFGVYLFLLIDDMSYSNSYLENASIFTKGTSKILIILGILMFVKQAPGYISDIFGIKSENMRLGIKGKLGSAAVVGGTIERKLNEAQGYVTGAAGGLMTGIRNRGIKTSEAIKSGAAVGRRKGGNQYSAQRDRIFQTKYGYEAEQGLLGGLSRKQKYFDKHEKDAENSWKERSNEYVENYEKTDKFKEAFKTFDKEQARKRIVDFRKTDTYKDALKKATVYWSTNKIDPNSERGKEVLNDYIDQARANTTDRNLRRRIDTYRNDQKTMELKYHSGVPLTFQGPKQTTLPDGTVVNTAAYQDWLDKTTDNNAFLLHAKQSTEKYATGELSRNLDGSLDKIYDEKYERESDFISHGAKSKSENQKLIDAIKGINTK